MPEHEPLISISLQNRFDQERAQAVAASRVKKVLPSVQAEPQQIDDYALECEVIPSDALSGLDWNSVITSGFMLDWPNGSKCCVAMLPFDYGGKNKQEQMIEGSWNNFLASKKFIRLLSVSRVNGLTLGYGDMAEPPGRYFAFMASEIQKDISQGGCTFDVEYSDPRNLSNSKDREWFKRQCRIAYRNLLVLIGRADALIDKIDAKDLN